MEKKSDNPDDQAPEFIEKSVSPDTSPKKQLINNRKLLWVVAGLIVITTGVLWLVLQETDTQNTHTNFETASIKPVKVEVESHEILNDILIPYYEARLAGDETKSNGFLASDIVYPYVDEEERERLPDLVGAEVIVKLLHHAQPSEIEGAEDFDVIERFNYIVQIMNEGDVHEEVVYIDKFINSESGNTKVDISSVMLETQISQFIEEEGGKRYKLIARANDRPADQPEVVVGIASTGVGCGVFHGSEPCVFLVNENINATTGWQKLGSIKSGKDHFSDSSYFAYDKKDHNSVLYSVGFGDAGAGYEKVLSLNIKSKKTRELVNSSTVAFTGIDHWPTVVKNGCSGIGANPFGVELALQKQSRKASIYICHPRFDSGSENPKPVRATGQIYLDDVLYGRHEAEVESEDDYYKLNATENVGGSTLRFSLFGKGYEL